MSTVAVGAPVVEVAPLITRKAVAELLQVDRGTVARMIEAGTLRATAGLPQSRVTGRSVVEFLEANEVPAKVALNV